MSKQKHLDRTRKLQAARRAEKRPWRHSRKHPNRMFPDSKEPGVFWIRGTRVALTEWNETAIYDTVIVPPLSSVPVLMDADALRYVSPCLYARKHDTSAPAAEPPDRADSAPLSGTEDPADRIAGSAKKGL